MSRKKLTGINDDELPSLDRPGQAVEPTKAAPELKTLNIRLPVELHKTLMLARLEDGISLNARINQLLQEWVDSQQK